VLDERESDVEIDGSSEMDWTPTGPSGPSMLQTIRPMLERISETSPGTSPSFFARSRGTLPPAPAHPAHRAARPEQPNPFEQRGMRVKGGLLAEESESDIETGGSNSNLFGRRGNGQMKGLMTKLAGRKEIPMAEPKFHLLNMNGSDSNASGGGETETGLEGLFNSVFSLSDDPKEVRDGQSRADWRERGMRDAVPETQPSGVSRFWLRVVFLSLLFALAAIGTQVFSSRIGDFAGHWILDIKKRAEGLLPVKTMTGTEEAPPLALSWIRMNNEAWRAL
jgi:hypothetical protein